MANRTERRIRRQEKKYTKATKKYTEKTGDAPFEAFYSGKSGKKVRRISKRLGKLYKKPLFAKKPNKRTLRKVEGGYEKSGRSIATDYGLVGNLVQQAVAKIRTKKFGAHGSAIVPGRSKTATTGFERAHSRAGGEKMYTHATAKQSRKSARAVRVLTRYNKRQERKANRQGKK